MGSGITSRVLVLDLKVGGLFGAITNDTPVYVNVPVQAFNIYCEQHLI